MFKRIVAATVAGAMLAACTTDPLHRRAEGLQHRRRRRARRAGRRRPRPSGRRQRPPQRADRRRHRRARRRRDRQLHGPAGSRAARAAAGHRRHVTRVGDQIILNMPSNITFATDQDAGEAAVLPDADLGRAGAEEVQPDDRRRLRPHRLHRRDSTISTCRSAAPFRSPTICRSQGVDQRRFAVDRLRRDAADRLQRDRSRPRPEPPRRNPAFAAHPGLVWASAAAISAASRALFSTSAMLVFRLAPPVSSSIFDSRNGVTALPETPCFSRRFLRGGDVDRHRVGRDLVLFRHRVGDQQRRRRGRARARVAKKRAIAVRPRPA